MLEGASLDMDSAGDNGVTFLGVTPAVTHAQPLLLRHADAVTLLFRLQRDSPGSAVPIGDLRLTWQRKTYALLFILGHTVFFNF